ncbi:MAG: ribose-5-phosphate isomerase RpiA [Candidatus Bipolaricaulota bacterium]|nr:ribose-5-phosphate isomerase RpiA [Candidatus Bipolaricaulota bacterium]MDW8126352.1 ribose-5-phosphate isomerase RpiA [Candidatus Bipolaricaulota bacterium]
MADVERWKREAAEAAVELVRPGMIIGLGHGSTARYALHKLAMLIRSGKLRDVRGVPCSKKVEEEAQALGIPLTTLEECPELDLTIDGADEIDPALNVIKGGGGAMLREKIVAQATRYQVIVAHEGKLSPRLGTQAAVPVEVLPFGWRTHLPFLESLGAKVSLRLDQQGVPVRTDQGNYILDCYFGPIPQPGELAQALDARAGILGHGLFVGLVDEVFVAGPRGLRRLRA